MGKRDSVKKPFSRFYNWIQSSVNPSSSGSPTPPNSAPETGGVSPAQGSPNLLKRATAAPSTSAEEILKDIQGWDAALKKSEDFGDLAGKPLQDHLAVLAKNFDDFRKDGKAIRDVVTPIFTVLVTLIGVTGEIPGVANIGAKAIAGAVAILFDETKHVTTAYDNVERLFRDLDNFFVRRDLYGRNVSAELQSVFNDILRHTVETLVIAARMIKNGRMLQYVSGFAGQGTDYQTAMQKMKELAQREMAIVSAENYRRIQEINTHYTGLPSTQPALVLKPVLPSRPRLVIGRAHEIETLVDALLTVPAPRLAILGPGGMGKTTLALTVLHDERLSPRWKQSSIYFVDCEGITSVELFVKELADVLRIPPNHRDFDVYDAVLHALEHRPVILCLDNFETPWEDLSIRPSIEQALQRLDELHDLALLITMRGIQRPAALSINWLTTLEPLTPLALEDAKSLFKQISHEMDSWSEELVRAVDAIPLAVKILAQLILERTETTKSLWDRWSKEWTAVVENGGNDRLSKLDTSIQLSVSRVNAPAQQMLGMLALLPDGLVSSEERINDLQRWIPKEINVKAALTILERKALVFRSGDRYQMLSPIRHFTLKHSTASTAVKHGLIYMYLMMLLTHGSHYTDPGSYSVLRPEMYNFRNILTLAFDMGDIPNLSDVAIVYTALLLCIGLATADILQRALCIPGLTPGAEADCLCWLGRIHLHWHKLDDAEQSLMRALELHEQLHDLGGQALDHTLFGVLHMHQGKLDDAEQPLKRALALHEQVQDLQGQGTDHWLLGRLHMYQEKLDDAEQSLKRAFQLHEQLQGLIWQGDDHHALGVLHMHRYELDDAEQSLKRGIALHEQVHSIAGQAYDHWELGRLHMHQGKTDDAEQSLKRALELHEQAQDLSGQGNDHQALGRLHMHQGKLDDAEQSLQRALALHEQVHDLIGQGNDHWLLGSLHMRQDKLDDAEQSLKQAFQLHEQVHDLLGQGTDHLLLGRLHRRRYEFDDAEQSLKRALALHEQLHSYTGQADDHQELGVLQWHQGKLDDAEQSLKRAIALHEQVHSIAGQACDHWELGRLHIYQNKLDDAEQSLMRALELHEQLHDLGGQALDHTLFGVLHMHQGKLDDAEQPLKRALALHEQVQDLQGQGNDHWLLGSLHMHQDKLDDAEQSLKQAFQLHEQVQDLSGQGNDHQALGRLHMHQGKFDDAEQSLQRALALHEQVLNLLGQADDQLLLGVLHMRWDEIDNVEQSLKRALALHEQAQSVIGQATDHEVLGELHMLRDKLEDAKQSVNIGRNDSRVFLIPHFGRFFRVQKTLERDRNDKNGRLRWWNIR